MVERVAQPGVLQHRVRREPGGIPGGDQRLLGLTWGAEDLGADVGASATRVDGDWPDLRRRRRR